MESEIAIRVENISKSFMIPHELTNTFLERLIRFEWKRKYEMFDALKDISFEIKKGEFFGVIGRNGSGKSTLLKIIAGIYTPSKGTINVNGEISPFLELGVGFNPELSGRDNIFLNGTILGLSKNEIKSEFDSIVAFSELERFIDQKLKNYSSGMQVRLAFSVSIHANKDIFIMDEVLAVGDARFQLKCFDFFEEMIKTGKTIVFVSHDTASMQKYADRVLYLESGNSSYIGNANEALSKYMYTEVLQNTNLEYILGTETISSDMSTNNNDTNEQTFEGIKATIKQDNIPKIIEIYEVKIFETINPDDNVLTNGHEMQIKLIIKVIGIIDNIIVRVIVRNDLHQDLFVTNTSKKQVLIGEMSRGTYELVLKMANYFEPGKYSVSIAICDQTQRVFYDIKDYLAYFEVKNPKRLVSIEDIEVPHQFDFLKYNP